MNAPDRVPDWTDANQRYLVAEFARLKSRLDGTDDTAAHAEVEAARAVLSRPAAIDRLARAFGLSAFEREILLLAAGVEMDSRLAAQCAQSSVGPSPRPWASFGLALGALADPHWSALAPVRPLRRWRLIEIDEGSALTSARLRLDEPVLHFLAGLDYTDLRLAPLLHPVDEAPRMADSHRALCENIVESLGGAPSPWPLVHLHGGDVSDREDIAAAVAALAGRRVQALDVGALPAAPADIAGWATLWARQAALSADALFVECGDEAAGPALRRFVERIEGLVFLSSDHSLPLRRASLRHAVRRPAAVEQRRLWRDAMGTAACAHEVELDAAVSHFNCSARRIAELAAGLRGRRIDSGTLWRACRDAAPARLAELAQRVDSRGDWDDLVLPAAQKQTLAQIVVHMRHRFEVHDAWGFAAKGSRGLGITALFAGDSGTGKTLAAEILARMLELELFRIDLSAVVSKYIGESEKNLRRVFDAAEDSGAILLFDEADALFGKRSEVKDSHDRYANIEVSYLLQRMESYRGLAILTTNHKAALDAAFMRRLRFVVHFPFPEAAEREAIWRRAFPAATPTRDLAWAKLARLQATGGHIQNIALGAAFHAADAGEPVGMVHVLRAAHAESAKRERAMSDSETRGWV